MTSNLVAIDEYLRPPAVYIMTYFFDRLSNSNNHKKLSASVCVGWEFIEHMTDITSGIPFLGPTLIGTMKDWLMDWVVLRGYPFTSEKADV
jgi:hypothetical protein